MVKTRHSKGDLPLPTKKSRPGSQKKQKNKTLKSESKHWLFGKFFNFEFSRTVLPLKLDVIRRYLSLTSWMSNGKLTRIQKNGLYDLIAKEIYEIWMYSSIPYFEKLIISKRVRMLITEALEFSHNNKKS